MEKAVNTGREVNFGKSAEDFRWIELILDGHKRKKGCFCDNGNDFGSLGGVEVEAC